MRRPTGAFTMAEVLVASSIGLLVLGGIMVIMQSVGRMSRFGELAGTLQEASLAMTIIEKDLMHAVQKADPSVDSPVVVKGDRFQLVRGDFRRDGSVHGALVVYRTVVTQNGNSDLLT